MKRDTQAADYDLVCGKGVAPMIAQVRMDTVGAVEAGRMAW